MRTSLKNEIIKLADKWGVDIVKPNSISFITEGEDIDIPKFIEVLDWYWVSNHKYLSEDFMEYFKEYLVWDYNSQHQPLSEVFLRRNEYLINWTIFINMNKFFTTPPMGVLVYNLTNTYYSEEFFEYLEAKLRGDKVISTRRPYNPKLRYK